MEAMGEEHTAAFGAEELDGTDSLNTSNSKSAPLLEALVPILADWKQGLLAPN